MTRSKTLGYKSNYKGALDLKYARGILVAPPSITGTTENGFKRKWLNNLMPVELPREVIHFFIRKRKKAYPNVKYYRRWSDFPSHKNQKP